MATLNPAKVGLAAVLLFSAVALTTIITFLVVDPTATPPSLPAARTVSQSPVVGEQFSDRQSVTVTFLRPPDAEVYTSMSGVVTTSSCAPGRSLQSGRSTFAVDGQPIVNLATSVPLWRDLRTGTTGSDVVALKAALERQGQSVSEGPHLGSRDIQSVDKLIRSAGGIAPTDRVAPEDFSWIPSPDVTTSKCSALVGQRVAAGAPLASIATSPQLQVTGAGGDLVPGDRVLDVAGILMPLSKRLAITSGAGINRLMESRAYLGAVQAAAPGAPVMLQASLSLIHPVSAAPLPPTAITSVSSDSGCVASRSRIYPVHIVGSQLGSTIVVFEQTPAPRTVTIDGPARCGSR